MDGGRVGAKFHRMAWLASLPGGGLPGLPQVGAARHSPDSESRARLRQICELIQRARTPERRVAMREASESADHIAMLRGIAGHFLAQRREQAHGFVLVGENFRVLEWQIYEHPLDLAKHPIDAACERGAGDLARLGIGRERLWRIAVEIARELVEQEDQCQSAVRCLRPVVERAFPGIAQSVSEARAGCVEFGGFLEPLLAMTGGITREPEIQHFAGCHAAKARSSSRMEWIASRPARSRIWWRHEVPSATRMSSVADLRTAGSRPASA